MMASHNAETIEISSFKTRAGQSWKLLWPHERVFSAQKVCIFSCRYISCGYSVLPPRQMACHFSFFLRHRVVVFAILKNCCLPNSVKNSLLVENRKICCFFRMTTTRTAWAIWMTLFWKPWMEKWSWTSFKAFAMKTFFKSGNPD